MAQNDRPTTVRRYAYALLIFSAALIARIALDLVIPGQLPFITFFPAVVAAAYFGGLRPGLMVLVLSSATGAVWLDPADGTSDLIVRLVGLVLFALLSGLNLYLLTSLQHANGLARTHEQQLALINRELKHRIKNLFSIAGSIAQQTVRSDKPPKEMSKAIAGRLNAVAAAQDLLSVTSDDGADVGELVTALVTPLAPKSEKLAVSGDPVRLPPDCTTPFGLILHELGTNALKYGAWSDNGYVTISWTIVSNSLEFWWKEFDGPAVAPPVREGLGSSLIKCGLPGAAVEHDLKSGGLECHIKLPL